MEKDDYSLPGSIVFVRFRTRNFCFGSLKKQGIGIVSLYSSSNRGSPSETTRFLFIWAKIQRAPFTGNRFAEKLEGGGESIMSRGVIWLLGTLLLSGLFIFALSGICSNASIFPSLTGYFCPKPRMKLITVPQNPTSKGVEQKKN